MTFQTRRSDQLREHFYRVYGLHHWCKVGSMHATPVCMECRTPYPCEMLRDAAEAFDGGETFRRVEAERERTCD